MAIELHYDLACFLRHRPDQYDTNIDGAPDSFDVDGNGYELAMMKRMWLYIDDGGKQCIIVHLSLPVLVALSIDRRTETSI